MIKKITLLVVVVSVLAQFVHAVELVDVENNDARCRGNEIYTDCGNRCRESCKTVKSPTPISCTTVCQRGCFCQQGTARNSKGVCVPVSKCS